MRLSSLVAIALVVAGFSSVTAVAQPGYNPEARLAAQREAMKKFDLLEGEWRGPAKTLKNDGTWLTMTQAERVGSMLGGTLKVIEGRGFMADDSVGFNAFAVISYDPDSKMYAMHSYAEGRVGDFPIVPTPTGFTWEIQAGPSMKIAYEAVIKDGLWTEIGTRIPKDGAPVKFIELTVTRLGDTTWPAAGAIPPR